MTYEMAVETWNQMSPMQRLEVLSKVTYVKSVTKRYRMTINYIMENFK